jgi:RNA polymerase sigma factor for flagellar operon FliA
MSRQLSKVLAAIQSHEAQVHPEINTRLVADTDALVVGETATATAAGTPGVTEPTVEAREAIADAIARLPEREKLVITLYYYEQLTMAEIAKILGVSASTVSRIHQKAVVRLKARLATQSGAGGQR